MNLQNTVTIMVYFLCLLFLLNKKKNKFSAFGYNGFLEYRKNYGVFVLYVVGIIYSSYRKAFVVERNDFCYKTKKENSTNF